MKNKLVGIFIILNFSNIVHAQVIKTWPVSYRFVNINEQSDLHDFVQATESLQAVLKKNTCTLELSNFLFIGASKELSALGNLNCTFSNLATEAIETRLFNRVVNAALKINIKISSTERFPKPGITISN